MVHKKSGARSPRMGENQRHAPAIAAASSFLAPACRPHARLWGRGFRPGRARGHEDAHLLGLFDRRPIAVVRSQVLAGRQGPPPRRRGDHRQGQERRPRRQSPGAAQPDHRGQAQLLQRPGPGAEDRLDLPAGRRAGHRQRGKAPHGQGDDHPDRQRHRREHQHDGRPGDHAREGHPEPARRPQELLDQARGDSQGRQHQDRRPERQRLAQGRRDRPGLDRLRSRAGREAHHRRGQRQRGHARPAAEVHALRQDHLRRRRARRGRPADPEHPDPRLGRRGEVLLRRPHHGDGRVQDVRLRRRAVAHGPEHAPGPLPDPLAHPGRRSGPVHREFLDPRHLQPLRDGARHQQPADPEQRDLQHRGPLLLHGRRRGDRQPVHPQPGDA